MSAPDFSTSLAHHLRAGTGRAVLHLRGHDWRPLAGAIEDACVRYPGYDAQCEGGPERAAWVADLIGRIGEVERFGEVVAAALGRPVPEGEHWSHGDHRLRLAGLLAEDGSEAARRAVRVAFERDPGESDAEPMARAFGVAGLVAVAAAIGRQLREGNDCWARGVAFHGGEAIGVAEAGAALRSAAGGDPDVAYLLAVADAEEAANEAKRAERTPRPADGRSVADLIADVRRGDRSGTSSYSLRRWAREADGARLIEAADALAGAADDRVRLALARAFDDRPFPGDPAVLLAMLDAGDSADPSVAADLSRAATFALGKVDRTEVREAAMGRLSFDVAGAVRMLAASYRPGDHAAIERAIGPIDEASAGEDEVHDVGNALRDVFERNAGAACAGPMRWLYERGRCSLCRRAAVRHLYAAGVLPASYIAEAEFDCDESVCGAAHGEAD